MPWDRRALTGSKVPKIDWIGGFLVTSGLSLFMFSLTQSGVVEGGWSVPCEPHTSSNEAETDDQMYLLSLFYHSAYSPPFCFGNDTWRTKPLSHQSQSSPCLPDIDIVLQR